MKINWNQNPFFTTIEIDDRDKEMILKSIQAEAYEDMLCDLDLWISGDIKTDIPVTIEMVAEKVSGWGKICNLTVESEQIQGYIDELKYPHCGDCICVPCSCMRCHVEVMLGVNTIEGLGKHSARKVEGAFGKDGKRTIDEAITILETPQEHIKGASWKNISQEDFEKHIPRWEKEREAAADWLRDYKQKHGF